MAESLGSVILEINTTTSGLNRGVDEAHRKAQGLDREFSRVAVSINRQWSGLGAVLRNFVSGPLGAVAAGFSALGLLRFAREIGEIGIAFERLEARFVGVTGALAPARQELTFVRELTDRLGLSFQASANAFSGMAAAAKNTTLGLQGARDIFIAVAEAAAAMQLSSDDLRGVLLALQQIISKGTVASEELRGQIGERLPGAFEIAARAMGVTTAELSKMLEQGQVLANDFLPRFARELRNSEIVQSGLATATETAAAAANRLSNAWDQLLAAVARSGPLQFAAATMENLARAMGALTEVQTPAQQSAAAFSGVLGNLGRQSADVMRQMASLQGQIEAATKFPGAEARVTALTDTLKKLQTQQAALQEQTTGVQRAQAQALALPGVGEVQVAGLPTRLPGEAIEDEVDKILKAFDAASDRSQTLRKAMGSSFDFLQQRAKDLRQAIEDLTDPTKAKAAADDPRVQRLARQLRQTEAQIKAQGDAERAGKRAAREEESQAKRISDILGDLQRQREALPSLGEALGEGFSVAEENVRLTEEAIKRLITSANLSPTSAQVRQLTEELAQLSQQRIGAALTRELGVIDREVAIFGDTMKGSQDRIAAYRKAIEDMSAELEDHATPAITELKTTVDALEGSLARQQEAAAIGDAYRTYADAVQAATQQHELFADEGQRTSSFLSALQTLLPIVTQAFGAQSDQVRAVVDQINQLKVSDLNQILAPSAREAEVFQRFDFLAEPFDLLSRQTDAVRNELQKLAADPSINLHSAQVQELTLRYRELSLAMDLRDLALEIGNAFSSAFIDAILGAKSFSDALKTLLEDITRMILQMAIMIPLQRAIFGLFSPTAPGAGPSAVVPGFQHGGSFTVPGSGGPDSRLVAFAATPGERVMVSPAGHGGGGNVYINVINNSGAQVHTQERQGPGGNRQIDIVVDEMVARSLTRSGSASGRALQSRFGASPGLIGR